MTGARCKREDGVRTIEALRGGCVIDDETGCWIWRGLMTVKASGKSVPRVWMPYLAGVRDEAGKAGKYETGARAAWLLSGRTLRTGEIVWRDACENILCINPEHGKAGTAAQRGAAMIVSGRLRGNPVRAAINAKNNLKRLTPIEVVRKAEAMFATGVMQKDVVQELGICNAVAARIRSGRHMNCASAQRVVPASSVFAWRPEA